MDWQGFPAPGGGWDEATGAGMGDRRKALLEPPYMREDFTGMSADLKSQGIAPCHHGSYMSNMKL